MTAGKIAIKVFTTLLFLALVRTGFHALSDEGVSLQQAENAALRWVRIYGMPIAVALLQNASDKDASSEDSLAKNASLIISQFYVLSSSKVRNGFCVEIASKERQPPKYADHLADITTIPLFVSKKGSIRESDISCFGKAYPDSRESVVRTMNKELRVMNAQRQSQQGHLYSPARFFLAREIGNIYLKLRWKERGYQLNYIYNPAGEYFADTLLIRNLNDQWFNQTMLVYVEGQVTVNGVELTDNFVKAVYSSNATNEQLPALQARLNDLSEEEKP